MSNSETLFPLISAIITASALIGYLNARFFRLPTTIAIMAGSMVLSLFFILIGKHGFATLEYRVYRALLQLDFHDILMQGMLSFLLFAGALTVNLNHLKECKWEIATLASLSTIASSFLVAALIYYLLPLAGVHMDFIYCLLFGALISPTDPIAVLAIFKEVGAPYQLDVTVSGESLFNDGVGIVLFITFYQLAFNGGDATLTPISILFAKEAFGGIFFGILLGLMGHWLIAPVRKIKVTILLTLAMTTGGYTLANALGVSGPLAMVAAGLFIGNQGKYFRLHPQIRENLYTFWEMIDEILNAILFFLIGIELIVINHFHWQIWIAILAIPLVLLVRTITVAIPIGFFKLTRSYPKHFTKILIWGGLRGGLAVALALSLPNSLERDLILTMTYAVVVFAVIVQGLSVKTLVRSSNATIG